MKRRVMLDPVEEGSLPLTAVAPGKAILFGEHSVVHGGPELLLSLELNLKLVVRAGGDSTRLNGDPEALQTNSYLREALLRYWSDGPHLEIRSNSSIPRAAGLGSSAAFAAALLATLGAAHGGVSRAELAQRAFEVERSAQGVGSPGDTSASVAGGWLTLNLNRGDLLWKVSHGDSEWSVRRISARPMDFIVGYSGIPRSTADAVRAFGRRVGSADGPELLERFERVAIEGTEALAKGDREGVGRAMRENHSLLREAGVSHPRLEALLDAVREDSDGEKLTGAGAGGSVLILPKLGHEALAIRRLAQAGGVPYPVKVSESGARLVEPSD